MSGNKRAERAQRYLTKIGEKLGLTPEGRNWLIMAIDPFNDSIDTCEGYPDGTGAKCIVEPIKETATIVVPSGANNVNWDCLIVDCPWVLPLKTWNSCQQGTAGTGTSKDLASQLLNVWNLQQSNNSSLTIGGVQVMSQPSSGFGFSNNWNPAVLVGQSEFSTFSMTPSTNVVTGNYRVIAKAFEVCNTTSELYKQGTVTIFRTPVPSLNEANAGSVWVGVNANPQIAATVLNMDSWPVTSSQAYQAIDSIQHAAADGVYVPATLNTDELSYENYQSTVPYIVMGDPTDAEPSPSSANNTMALHNQSVNITSNEQYGFPGIQWSNFHMGGCLFQGLSPQTTLQINVKWLIEKFPSQNDAVLVPICHRSPDRDHVAIEMYSHLANSMPVGCKFADNGFGDWISDALSTVADYVAPVLSVIPHPAAQAIGAGLMVANHVRKQPVLAPPVPNFQNVARQMNAKANNEYVKMKNAQTRAKNEEVRARKALKGKGKK